jgi:recombination protein U
MIAVLNNRGMYAEEVIERTCIYYLQKQIAIIEKRQIPFKIMRTLGNNIVNAKLLNKSTIDYIGIYKSHHIEFEVKQTHASFFSKNLIKKHQYQYMMNLMNIYNIIPRIILYFDLTNEFFVISFRVLHLLFQQGSIIPYEIIRQRFPVLAITFPGIVDFLPYFDID